MQLEYWGELYEGCIKFSTEKQAVFSNVLEYFSYQYR